MKKEIHTSEADSVPGVLSQAVDTGTLVFVSGQINISAEGKMVGETVEQKLQQIMQNIRLILEAASLEINDVVKATIFVTDLSQMAELNKYYPTYFTAPFPAREAIGVKELPLGATIEISVIASR